MKRALCAAILALSTLVTSPALAWDPDQLDPIDPAPVPPPPGIYLVTDTYAGDSVTRAGDVTTYSTETVHEITGSYARVLDTVGTGASSAYDGAAFNRRAVMTDGRAVAGTYYENYVPTDRGFVPVSGSVADTRSEVCWAAVTKNGRFVYVTNFGDGTISTYAIGADGSIELLDAVAASTRLGEPGIRDEALTRDGRFLYAIDADAQRIFGWTVAGDGRLTAVGEFEGVPATVAGLAAS